MAVSVTALWSACFILTYTFPILNKKLSSSAYLLDLFSQYALLDLLIYFIGYRKQRENLWANWKRTNTIMKRISTLLSAIIIAAFYNLYASQVIPLSGKWQFSLDRNDVGEQEQWFRTVLPKTNANFVFSCASALVMIYQLIQNGRLNYWPFVFHCTWIREI